MCMIYVRKVHITNMQSTVLGQVEFPCTDYSYLRISDLAEIVQSDMNEAELIPASTVKLASTAGETIVCFRFTDTADVVYVVTK